VRLASKSHTRHSAATLRGPGLSSTAGIAGASVEKQSVQRPPLRRLRNQIAVPRSRTIRTIHHQSPASPLKSGAGVVGCALAGEARRRARNISAVKNLKRGGMLVAPCREVGSAPEEALSRSMDRHSYPQPPAKGIWRSSYQAEGRRSQQVARGHRRRVADRAEGRYARGSSGC
jgi:hypothetical protein